MAIIAVVNRTLLRRSGILKTFFRFASTCSRLVQSCASHSRPGDEVQRSSSSDDQRLANWLPLAAGRPAFPSALNGSGTSVTVPPAAVIAASAAFDTAWVWTWTAE